MTMFAPTDVQSVTIPRGCNQTHLAPGNGEPFALNCPLCEIALAEIPSLGWAAAQSGVKPTCDEVAAAERAERDAKKAGVGALNALALGQLGAGGGGRTLVEQILALSPTERAALRVLLGGDADAPAAGQLPQLPAVVEGGEPAPAPAPVKRGPGRPRRTPLVD